MRDLVLVTHHALDVINCTLFSSTGAGKSFARSLRPGDTAPRDDCDGASCPPVGRAPDGDGIG
jgi:hypothetical protein